MENTVIIPDGIFWYSLATLLAIALIWIIQRYVSKIDTMLLGLTESVNKLITITSVHEVEITNLKDDMKKYRGQ